MIINNRSNSKHKNIQTLDSTTLKVLDEFVKDYKLDRKDNYTTLVFSKNLDELKSHNGSVELLLNHLAKNYGSLFYGSPISIKGYYNGYKLKSNGSNIICCTDLGAAALINSLLNKQVNVKKPIPPKIIIPTYMNSNHPFKVDILGLNNESIKTEGFVYVVNNTRGFEKISSWQFINKINKEVPINAKIPTSNYDFKYSINDLTNDKLIRTDVEFKRKYY